MSPAAALSLLTETSFTCAKSSFEVHAHRETAQCTPLQTVCGGRRTLETILLNDYIVPPRNALSYGEIKDMYGEAMHYSTLFSIRWPCLLWDSIGSRLNTAAHMADSHVCVLLMRVCQSVIVCCKQTSATRTEICVVPPIFH